MLGLWDQGLFTDALISAVRAEHIYPYTYLQVPRPNQPDARHTSTLATSTSHSHTPPTPASTRTPACRRRAPDSGVS